MSNPASAVAPQLRLRYWSLTGSGSSGTVMTTPAIGQRLTFRLTAATADGRTVPQCFAEYGFSRGLADLMYVSPIPMLTGSFGAGFESGARGELFSIAAYQFDPLAAACAPAVIR